MNWDELELESCYNEVVNAYHIISEEHNRLREICEKMQSEGSIYAPEYIAMKKIRDTAMLRLKLLSDVCNNLYKLTNYDDPFSFENIV